MKMIKTLGLTLAAASLMTISVQAFEIVGSIGFTGAYTQNGGTPGELDTATSFSIAPAGFAINPFSLSGDFVGATTPASFASPIGVNGNPPAIGTLWTVTVSGDLYTFTVTSQSQTFTSDSQLNLAGTGIISAPGKDSTPGNWQLGFGRSTAALTFQSTAANNVPEGGSTLVLLGAALVGLLGFARKSIA